MQKVSYGAKTLILAMLVFMPMKAGAADARQMIVYKSPYCGCCDAWAEAFEQMGYHIVTKDVDDMDWAKEQMEVPESMESCHTAVIDGYVIEGHVPPQAVSKLLYERPDVKGIAVPGMPEGSLGMGYDPRSRYVVYQFGGKDEPEPKPYYEMGGR